MEMTAHATIGHNRPPVDPRDAVVALHADTFTEADNWPANEPITEAQLPHVDALMQAVKDAVKDAEAAKEAEFRPAQDAVVAVQERWNPTIKEWNAVLKRLLGLAEPIRKARAKAAEDARRAAFREADALKAAGESEAHMAALQAIPAKPATGLRTYTAYDVRDAFAALGWLLAKDEDAVRGFLIDMKKRHPDLPGVDARKEKRAI
jgi:hypothetical protein